MAFAVGVVVLVVGLLVSIALHEIGHMVPAKRFGVRVSQYMVGFGPTLWSRTRGETEYGLKLIPLGGFCKIVGMTPQDDDVAPEVFSGEVRPGDVFLVASDGLTGMVEDRRLQQLLASRAAPARVVDALIAEANGRGGLDNITAIIVQVHAVDAANSVGGAAASGSIAAPMPGKVTAVEVSQGEKVVKGQRLLTLEAMKMEHGLVAPFDGVVAQLSAEAGAQVSEGTILARVEPKESE